MLITQKHVMDNLRRGSSNADVFWMNRTTRYQLHSQLYLIHSLAPKMFFEVQIGNPVLKLGCKVLKLTIFEAI